MIKISTFVYYLEYVYMDIKSKFLTLTKRTYPHGHEEDLFHLLPQDLEIDEFGNLYKLIGNPSTMFTSHLDTATAALTEVNHVIEGDIIKTDGKSILGADDKAGVTVMLYMIEQKIPGLYYFFLGEEVGCVGSTKTAESHSKNPMSNINKVVSFDRRGTGSVITHQTSRRCCSEEFGKALADALNMAGSEVYDNDTVLSYKTDDGGLYTDSAKFIGIYPECTNISVGYYSEHMFSERIDIKHLDKLAKAACLVDWESLPIKRDPKTVEYSYTGRYSHGYDEYWDEYPSRGQVKGYSPAISNYSSKEYAKSYTENHWFVDNKYSGYCSYVTTNKWTKKVTDTDLSSERISMESELIAELLRTLDVDYESIKWNGFKLIVEYHTDHRTECDRNDLNEFLPELDFWKEMSEDHKEQLEDFGFHQYD
jgi:hypothetical protein